MNRWPHGYSYTYNSLYDDPQWSASGHGPHEQARARHHRISIANSDSHAGAFMDDAIDAGLRAAREQWASSAREVGPADPSASNPNSGET